MFAQLREKCMAAVANSLPDLNEAVRQANSTLEKQGYKVSYTNKEIKPKEPIDLSLEQEGQKRNIGITHLVHLRDKNWDQTQAEQMARTTDEVANSILARLHLFLYAEKQPHLWINKTTGAIFDFGDVGIQRNLDNTFSIGEIPVTYRGKLLTLDQPRSEGIMTFQRIANGDISIADGIDLRKGKRIFINSKGEIYRG
jgi:hypothetical protein